MLRSPLLKHVANPPKFIFMPPLLAGASIASGLFLWFFGIALDFSPIPGILIGLGACIVSIYLGTKEPHLDNLLRARQAFMRPTPQFIARPARTRTYHP